MHLPRRRITIMCYAFCMSNLLTQTLQVIDYGVYVMPHIEHHCITEFVNDRAVLFTPSRAL